MITPERHSGVDQNHIQSAVLIDTDVHDFGSKAIRDREDLIACQEPHEVDSPKALMLEAHVPRPSPAQVSPKVALELCAGSARLTRCFLNEGLSGAVGIDYLRNQSRPVGPVIILDLTSDHGQDVIMKSLRSGNVAVVTLAVPCGTASRARERPLSATRHGPRPLRTEHEPWGTSDLAGVDLVRVQQANVLYKFAIKVFEYCVSHQILVMLENPARSLVWSIPEVAALLDLPGVQDKLYDACMHGGTRLKHQRLRSNISELQDMAGLCDGQHTHEPYTYSRTAGFDTSKEAIYPWEFCENVARLVALALQRKGFKLEAGISRPQAWKISSGRQPRGKMNPKLMSEFKEIAEIIVPHSFNVNALAVGKRLTTVLLQHNGTIIPIGSKFLEMQKGQGTRISATRMSADLNEGKRRKTNICEGAPKETQNENIKLTFGIYRQPSEFVREALALNHPQDCVQALSDRQGRMLSDLMCKSKDEVKQFRTMQLERIKALAKELQPQEDELHSKLPAATRKILEGKRILLLQRLMREAGIPDRGFISRMVAGFELLGDLPETGLFPKQFRPPRISKQELMKTAKVA